MAKNKGTLSGRGREILEESSSSPTQNDASGGKGVDLFFSSDVKREEEEAEAGTHNNPAETDAHRREDERTSRQDLPQGERKPGDEGQEEADREPEPAAESTADVREPERKPEDTGPTEAIASVQGQNRDEETQPPPVNREPEHDEAAESVAAARPSSPPSWRQNLLRSDVIGPSVRQRAAQLARLDTGLPAWSLWLSGLLVLIALGIVAMGVLSLRTEPEAMVPRVPTNVFFDDFSDPGSGLFVGEDQAKRLAYENGRYVIEVHERDYLAWTFLGQRLRDFDLEVEGGLATGAADAYYGVLFRYQDPDNFYFFAVRADGTFAAGGYDQGERFYFGEPWVEDDAIRMGGASNRLGVRTQGNTFALFANGEQLVTLEDPALPEGDIALFAASGAAPVVQVEFESLLIQDLGE